MKWVVNIGEIFRKEVNMLDNLLKRVAVIGAGGKMGRGISFLLLQEMSQKLFTESDLKLTLIDVDEKSLLGLKTYLKNQLVKFAEKNIIYLRDLYSKNESLIDNKEIIDDFVEKSLSIVREGTELNSAKDAKLVFEAILENVDLKIKIFSSLSQICSSETYFFSNTSSIPISVLDSLSCLHGRIIGYHFYNPPPVQKLVEVIPASTTKKELIEIGFELGKRLKKILVTSMDKAAFIGNGHFLRDVSYVLEKLDSLKIPKVEAIYCMNRISQDFMLRPMGIFQLLDYVGIDVADFIYAIMEKYLPSEKFEHRLIGEMVRNKIKGGQFADGSQKDGFLKYENNKPVGVYSLEEGRYILFNEGDWRKKCDEKLGSLPKSHLTWKVLSKDKQKEEKLSFYFKELFQMTTWGAELAKEYLIYSKKIAQKLVEEGVAKSTLDVNLVLMNGFYHLYGAVNQYY